MAGNELQKAIDDLRARVMPQNLPYVEAVERAVGAEIQTLRTGIRSMVAIGRDFLAELSEQSDDTAPNVGRERVEVHGPSLREVSGAGQ